MNSGIKFINNEDQVMNNDNIYKYSIIFFNEIQQKITLLKQLKRG